MFLFVKYIEFVSFYENVVESGVKHQPTNKQKHLSYLIFGNVSTMWYFLFYFNTLYHYPCNRVSCLLSVH